MFETFEKHTAEFMKSWEQAAGRWWDDALRDPANLAGLGRALNDACAAKERGDRALEDHWSRMRLPSAADVERIHERLSDLEEQLGRIEALLLQRQGGTSEAAGA